VESAKVLAASAQNVAVIQDNAWSGCISEEAIRLTEVTLFNDSAGVVSNTCDTIEPTKMINQQLFIQNPFECNHEVQGAQNCDNALAAFEASLEGELETMDQTVDLKVNSWNAAVEECTRTTIRRNGDLKEIRDAVSRYEKDRSQCDIDEEERTTGICQFQTNFKDLCSAAQHYESVKSQASGSGTGYSASDRHAEFETTDTVRCALERFLSLGLAPTDADVAHCQQAAQNTMVSHPDLNLTLSLHESRFASAMLGFDCEQVDFSFSGSDWTVPSPDVSFTYNDDNTTWIWPQGTRGDADGLYVETKPYSHHLTDGIFALCQAQVR